MRLAIHKTGVTASGPGGRYVKADDPLFACCESWLRIATDAEREAWTRKGSSPDFDLLRPSGLGGGWLQSSQVLTSATRALLAPKSTRLPVSASSVEARRAENQGLGDGQSPSSGGGTNG